MEPLGVEPMKKYRIKLILENENSSGKGWLSGLPLDPHIVFNESQARLYDAENCGMVVFQTLDRLTYKIVKFEIEQVEG
jgi:hypothetical protein